MSEILRYAQNDMPEEKVTSCCVERRVGGLVMPSLVWPEVPTRVVHAAVDRVRADRAPEPPEMFSRQGRQEAG